MNHGSRGGPGTRLRRFGNAIVAAATICAALAPVSGRAAGEAKNVIFFVGDGMGPVTITAARVFKYKEEGALTMDTLPYTARVKTHSLDAQTTDSAAAMAAYMTGIKTRNDVLAMDSNTRAIGYAPLRDAATGVADAVNNCPDGANGLASTTLLELASAKGKATGAVSTARLTHATPAATYAHVCHRGAEYEIARQAVPGGAGYNVRLDNGVDVLMGGISHYWRPYVAGSRPQGRPDGRDLVAELQAKGYTFVNDLATLNAAPAAPGVRLIGLFDFAEAQGHMSYELDRDPTKEPSLAQMTAKAIDVLAKNPNGYFLMVEGGRIDHALHATNARRALVDTIAFDDAIRTALAKIDPTDTLVVVTADHDHTMAFNGGGRRGSDILGINTNVATGKPKLDVNNNTYTTLLFGNGPNRPNTRATAAANAVAGTDYLQEAAIRRSSETHGGGDVMLFATGAGAQTFKGTIDNTRVFLLVKSAAGY